MKERQMNFFDTLDNFGTTEKLKSNKQAQPKRTIDEMREDLISRAQLTIAAIEGYDGGKLKAHMVKTVRHGFAVKVGYGKKNEVVLRFGEKEERFFRREQPEQAIAYLAKIISGLEGGELDGLLNEKLNDLRNRFRKADTPKTIQDEVSTRHEGIHTLAA
jgi:hypothetical protein